MKTTVEKRKDKCNYLVSELNEQAIQIRCVPHVSAARLGPHGPQDPRFGRTCGRQ